MYPGVQLGSPSSVRSLQEMKEPESVGGGPFLSGTLSPSRTWDGWEGGAGIPPAPLRSFSRLCGYQQLIPNNLDLHFSLCFEDRN